MASTSIVTFNIEHYGVVKVTSAALDLAVDKFLPASPNYLKAQVAEQTLGYPDVADLDKGLQEASAIELVAVLADFEYNYDGGYFSVYA